MNVSMPSSVAAGRKLLAWVSTRYTQTWTTIPSGWNQVNLQAGGSGVGQLTLFEKLVTSGTEGGTSPTWVCSSASPAIWQAIEVDGADTSMPIETAKASGDYTTNPNPPALTPPFGSEDILWIELASNSASTNLTTGASTNYSDYQQNSASAGGAQVNVACAFRQLTAASEDPGLFAAPSNIRYWATMTIAVRPAGTTARIRSYGTWTSQTNVAQTIPSIAAGDSVVYIGQTSDDDNVHREIDAAPTVDGVSMTPAPGRVTASGQKNQVDIYVLKNAAAGTSVTLQTTYHAGSPAYVGAWFVIANADTATQPASSGSDAATSGTAPSVSLSSVAPDDLILSTIASSGTPTSSSSSVLYTGSGNGTNFRLLHRRSSTSTPTEAWSQSSSAYAAAAIVIKAATGGGAGTTGQIKVYDGSAFVAKPVKIWNGSSWETKPVKRWDGSSWVTTPY
ncbi:hypothetical protein [Mycolicibacterium sp. S3B2]|uniref:hypothetical protein n=1 Tax=Mycolicibacterium sp. S3B2 TaxID=3415120 RepID=UPI003C7BA58C